MSFDPKGSARIDLAGLSDEDRELLELAEARVDEWLTSLAGEALPGITASRAGAEQALATGADGVRAAAVHVLCRRWLPPAEATEVCFTYLADANVAVAECAVQTLGELLKNTRDARAGRALAEIALDGSRPLRMRLTAYRALVFVHDTHLIVTHNLVTLAGPDEFDRQLLGVYLP
jgi:hypothetical protein